MSAKPDKPKSKVTRKVATPPPVDAAPGTNGHQRLPTAGPYAPPTPQPPVAPTAKTPPPPAAQPAGIPAGSPQDLPIAFILSKKPEHWTREDVARVFTLCMLDCEFFISNFCVIGDKAEGKLFKFKLWPDQKKVLAMFTKEKKLVVLKARQLGMTWLAICYGLWLMLFKPGVNVLLFSVRDIEAMKLLERLKEVYDRLPEFMRCTSKVKDDGHILKLSNGSDAMAFPTGTGDSYTAALAISDEADMPDPAMQLKMMAAIEPTIERGGQLFLISRANKQLKWENSLFKSTYTDAKSGKSRDWKHVFLPWWSCPHSTQDDYDEWKRKSLSQTFSLDMLYSNYPESDEQALAPSSGDKRIAVEWLMRCHRDQQAFTPAEMREHVPQLTHIRGLRVYREAIYGRKYVGGGDPAEGTPNSNPSALVLVDATTGEEVLALNEKLSPASTGKVMDEISAVYNGASWLVERNNHGHAAILWMNEHSHARLLEGPDKRAGWPSDGSLKNKTILFDWAVEVIRAGQTIIHSFDLYSQLCMVESETLKFSKGAGNTHGDLAMAYVLALKGTDIDRYGAFKPEDFAWDAGGGSKRPFGVDDHRRGGSSPFGTTSGGGSPFGVR